MSRPVIDLHTHTTASDGLLRPEELVRAASEAGLSTIAITDHDTAAGVRALEPASRAKLTVIPGVEISASVRDKDLHVLGLFIEPTAPRLLAFEEERRTKRLARLEEIVAKLRGRGLAIDMAEVLAQPGGESGPGRPHVARVLVAKGYATGMNDAFRRILGPDGPGYVPYDKPEAAEAVALIHAAGGIAAIAHPGLDGLDPHLDELLEKGMTAIEVFHPDHDPAARERYLAFARSRGIPVSGGSDFHGEGRKDGGRLGATTLPEEDLAALRKAWEERR